MANVKAHSSGDWPDLSGGACGGPKGQALVDAYMSASAEKPKGTAKALKDLCSRCPIAARCAAMVLALEEPGGAWDGVYAGLTAADRRHIWERKQKEKTAQQ
jgi:hypothetical protein